MLAQPPTVPPLADQAGSRYTGYTVEAAVSNAWSGLRVTAVDVAGGGAPPPGGPPPRPTRAEAARPLGCASRTRPSAAGAGTHAAALAQGPPTAAPSAKT